MRLGDKNFGVDPESHYGTLTTFENGKPKRSTYATVQPATYVEYYRLFARALQGNGEVPVKPQDAAGVLRVIEAAQQSSKEGRTIDL